jgi:hypothetical protein
MLSHDQSQSVQFQLREFPILCESCLLQTKPQSDFTMTKYHAKHILCQQSNESLFFPNEPFFRTKVYWHGSTAIWQAIVTYRGTNMLPVWRVLSSVCWKLTDISENTSRPPPGMNSKPSKKLAWSRQIASNAYVCLQRLTLQTWWWTWHIHLRYPLTFNGVHGIVTQKTKLLIITDAWTSNPVLLVYQHVLITWQ